MTLLYIIRYLKDLSRNMADEYGELCEKVYCGTLEYSPQWKPCDADALEAAASSFKAAAGLTEPADGENALLVTRPSRVLTPQH